MILDKVAISDDPGESAMQQELWRERAKRICVVGAQEGAGRRAMADVYKWLEAVAEADGAPVVRAARFAVEKMTRGELLWEVDRVELGYWAVVGSELTVLVCSDPHEREMLENYLAELV